MEASSAIALSLNAQTLAHALAEISMWDNVRRHKYGIAIDDPEAENATKTLFEEFLVKYAKSKPKDYELASRIHPQKNP